MCPFSSSWFFLTFFDFCSFLTGWQVTDAANLVSIMNFIVGASPIFGYIVDRFGRRHFFFTVGSALLTLSFLVLGTTTDTNPAVWFVFLGLSVAITQPNVVATVPMLVNERVTAQAYAVLSLVNNAGMLFLPPIVGRLRSSTGGFGPAIAIFTGIASLSLLSALILLVLDWRRGNVFSLPPSASGPKGRGILDTSKSIFM
jgi:MFS family permease